MKISPVSNNNQNYNVSFGKFADKNAKKVVRKALTINDTFMQSVYDTYFKRIEECDFFEAYTDKKSGKVKGRFTDEFVKSNADNLVITRRINSIKEYGEMDDLSNTNLTKSIAGDIQDIADIAKGVDLSKKCLSKKPHGDASDEDDTRNRMFSGLYW